MPRYLFAALCIIIAAGLALALDADAQTPSHRCIVSSTYLMSDGSTPTVAGEEGCSLWTPTPENTATPTLEPTSTPTQTAEPTSTATSTPVIPTSTSTPTASPSPTTTPTPVPLPKVTDYGATGNGSTDDTAAIQAAINGATGTLVFPAGEYRLTNKLQAKTGLNLVFEEGSRLIQYGNAAILDFSGVTDVTITGPVLHHTGSVSPGGPSVIHSDGTMARVSFYDVTIERCDGWCFRLRGDDLLLDGYVNTNRTYQTSNVDDGLTVAGKRITVRNFDIATNDDAISVKVFTGGETQNVLIENGTIRSRDGGLTFGSEIRGPLHDVTVRGVHFDDVKVPLYFKMLEATSSGHVTNVLIENITSEGNALWRLLHFHTVGGRENTAHDNTIRNAHHTGDVLHQCILVQNQPGNTLEDVICN